MKIYDWKRFATFISIVLLIILLCLAQCTKKENRVKEVVEYEVQSGETLWSIGTEYRPSTMSIQEYIYNLKELNNIGSIIYPNQVIKVLVYEEV